MIRARLAVLPVVLLAGGCAAEAVPVVPPGRLPAPLERMTLNRDHPTALPVDFAHAFHAGPATGLRCSDCHHELQDRPEAVPSACTECHLPVYLAPEVDESQPHEHVRPPDL